MRANQDTVSVLDVSRFYDQLPVHHHLIFFGVFSVRYNNCATVVFIVIQCALLLSNTHSTQHYLRLIIP